MPQHIPADSFDGQLSDLQYAKLVDGILLKTYALMIDGFRISHIMRGELIRALGKKDGDVETEKAKKVLKHMVGISEGEEAKEEGEKLQQRIQELQKNEEVK